MVRTYVISAESFAQQRPAIGVDVPSEEHFDEGHALEQAALLKEQVGAAAVVVHHGGKFWVV